MEDEAKVTIEELTQLAQVVPLMRLFGMVVEEVEAGAVTVRVPYHDDFARPGGTIAGPILMAVADFTMWAVVASLLGRAELAVTTNLNINFLRRPPPGELIARGSILKLGKRMAIGEISLYCGEEEDLVAHVTCTYALPVDAVLPEWVAESTSDDRGQDEYGPDKDGQHKEQADD